MTDPSSEERIALVQIISNSTIENGTPMELAENATIENGTPMELAQNLNNENCHKLMELLNSNKNLDLNGFDENGKHILYHLGKFGDKNLIKKAVEKGATLAAKSNKYSIRAIENINCDFVKIILDSCVESKFIGSGKIQVNVDFRVIMDGASDILWIFVTSKHHKELLQHPLIEKFTDLQFRHLKKYFYINIVLVILTLCFSTAVMNYFNDFIKYGLVLLGVIHAIGCFTFWRILKNCSLLNIPVLLLITIFSSLMFIFPEATFVFDLIVCFFNIYSLYYIYSVLSIKCPILQFIAISVIVGYILYVLGSTYSSLMESSAFKFFMQENKTEDSLKSELIDLCKPIVLLILKFVQVKTFYFYFTTKHDSLSAFYDMLHTIEELNRKLPQKCFPYSPQKSFKLKIKLESDNKISNFFLSWIPKINHKQNIENEIKELVIFK